MSPTRRAREKFDIRGRSVEGYRRISIKRIEVGLALLSALLNITHTTRESQEKCESRSSRSSYRKYIAREYYLVRYRTFAKRLCSVIFKRARRIFLFIFGISACRERTFDLLRSSVTHSCRNSPPFPPLYAVRDRPCDREASYLAAPTYAITFPDDETVALPSSSALSFVL